MEAEFTRIIETNAWGSPETPCGPGSTLQACAPLLARLPLWFSRYKIHSLADLGCGDWNWMQHLRLAGIQYDGFDVVKDLVEKNRRHARGNVRFHHADVSIMTVPKVDLVLVKDLLQHLPTETALELVAKVRQSGSGYLAATTAVGAPAEARKGMGVGGFVPLDLESSPFNLGAPVDAVDVPRKPGNPRKLLALWPLSQA